MDRLDNAPAPPEPPPLPRVRADTRAGAIALVVIASLLLFLAVGLFAGGSVLMWADRTQRDAAGYLTSPTATLTAPDYAVATTEITVALSDPAWHASTDALGTVRITAMSSGTPVFLGVAPRAEVVNYLKGVAYDEPTGFIGGGAGFQFRLHPGGAPTTPPAQQPFWAVQASGPGTQTLTWDVSSGKWAAVLMNVDGSRRVAVDVAVGATVPFLFGLALGLLITGAVALLFGAVLIVVGVRMLGGRPYRPYSAQQPWAAEPADPPATAASAPVFPLQLEGRLDARLSRWLWLVKSTWKDRLVQDRGLRE